MGRSSAAVVPVQPAKASAVGTDSSSLDFRRLAAVIVGCFAAGAAWPVVSGINLAPRPPGLSKKAAVELPSGLDPNTDSDDSSVPSLSRTTRHVTEKQMAILRQTVVTSCGSSEAATGKECDTPFLMTQLAEPLRNLADCDEAEGTSGMLSLGLKLDFGRNYVSAVQAGKSTTLSKRHASELIRCATDSLVGTSLRGVEHDHRYYWVYFVTEFIPPGSPLYDGEPFVEETIPASGRATVGWTNAEVRQEAAASSELLFELKFGSRVQVTGRSGNWYKVKFGSPTQEGWVHRTALGL